MNLPAATTIRLTPSDKKVLKALEHKLGVGAAAIIRMAIRRLAEMEKVA